MASICTPISCVSGGRKDLKLKTRVSHIWLIPDKENADEIVCMNMLLVDEKAGRIHATVRKHLVREFREKVQEGQTYLIENILVGFNEGPFKVTPHKHKITMMHGSKFTKIADSKKIPLNSFDFVSFPSVLESFVEDKTIDVIGHVVEKSAMRETEKNGRKSRVIDLTLEDLDHRRIHCSLWGEFADQAVTFFESHDMSKPAILIMQFGKTRKYMGAMGVSNAFFGTKVVINGDYQEFVNYRTRMGNADPRITHGVSQTSGHTSVPLTDDLLNTKRMTIEDLIESDKPCLGTVLGTVCEIESGMEWYFRSCTQCASLVTINDGKLTCKRCTDCKGAVLRFKLHVVVMDETGSTTFVFFDQIVTQFIGRTVQDLLDGNEAGDYPTDFEVFVDKQMLFKVEVSKGNVNYRWRNYAVKKATMDNDIIQQFLHRHNLKASVDEEVTGHKEPIAAKNVDPSEAVECVDSCSNVDAVATPTNKSGVKRGSDVDDTAADVEVEGGSASTTKPTKLARVNVDDAADVHGEVGSASTNKAIKLKSVKIEKEDN